MRDKNHIKVYVVKRRYVITQLLATILMLTSIASIVKGQNSNAPGNLAFTNVTLIDGSGGVPRSGMTIAITGGKIADLFITGKKRLPSDVRVLDMRGRYVIPGLIDSHVHLTAGARSKEEYDALLRFAFLGGITSVRDMGGDGTTLAELSRAARDESAKSPRIYFSAIMAGPTWFSDPRAKASAHGLVPGEAPWLRAITPETDIPKIIAEAKAAGATGIKMYADLPADLLKKLTVEAHRQGMRVWSHATIFPSKPGDALNAGVDVLSHSALLVYEGVTEVPETYHTSRGAVNVGYGDTQPDSAVMTKLLRRMQAQGTILDATLFVTGQLARPGATTNTQDPRLGWTFEITKRAHQLGVPISAGTDGMGSPGRADLPNIHTEMELLVTKCGLTPLEAITAATRNGARVLGIEAVYGTVAIGKAADLVLLDADPSTDIRNTRRIVSVIKGGRLYLRKEKRNE